MDMFEEARALAVTMKMRKMSQSELAKTLGVSQSFVANKLRLLKLEQDLQDKILQYGLTERHARALLRIKDYENRKTVLDRACNECLSVQRTEALVDLYHSANAPKIIGRADRLLKIDVFLDTLKESVSVLSAEGIMTSKKVSYEKDKIFISICINNRQI